MNLDTASQVSSVEEEEEDEAFEMIKRISVMSQPRPSLLQAGTAGPPDQQRGSFASGSQYSGSQNQNQRTVSQQPASGSNRSDTSSKDNIQDYRNSKRMTYTLASVRPNLDMFQLDTIGELDDFEDSDEDSEHMDDRPTGPGVNRDDASKLRREAEQADATVDKYTLLVQQGMNVVSEVKSALYDADDSGQDMGAELLLDEVRDMLGNVVHTSMAEASGMQTMAQHWLENRKKTMRHLRTNHIDLEASIKRRAEVARESNSENRADCDRLWREIQDLESQIDGLPRVTQGPADDEDFLLSPGSTNGDGSPVPGVLSLEGAHSLLRSFNAVLRPHMTEIIPQKTDMRSSSEAIAQEFLNACNESIKQTASQTPNGNGRSKNSPPPLQVPSLPRCNSSPSIIHGDRVESTKPVGLLPLELVKKDSEGLRLLQEEQRALLSKVGRSY